MGSRGELWNATWGDYLADPRWSCTGIKCYLDEGPRAAKLYHGGTLRREDTRATRIGRFFHCAVLEPDVWAKHTCKDWDARTAEGKARAAEVREQGLTVIAADEYETVQGMRESVAAAAVERAFDGDPFLADLLTAKGLCEQSVRWQCHETGLQLKCRWDKAIPAAHVIVDLKTADRWRPDDWGRWQAAKYRYHLQQFLYCDAYRAVYEITPRFIFLVVHNKPPYEVATYELGAQEQELGALQYQRAARDIVAREQSGVWHCDEERGLRQITYPAYVHMDEEMARSF